VGSFAAASGDEIARLVVTTVAARRAKSQEIQALIVTHRH
jgi:hypothetical protein